MIVLKGIIKRTPSSNPDFENLVKAANEVEKVIVAIDQNVKGGYSVGRESFSKNSRSRENCRAVASHGSVSRNSRFDEEEERS